LLTHGHVDHFGGAAELRAATGAPIAIHAADLAFLRSGRNPDLRATGLEGQLFRPFLPWSAPPLTPDIVFDSALDLAAFGLTGQLFHVPGHSPGSVALALPGGALIAGDLLRGGFAGGRLWLGRPNPPFYVRRPGRAAAQPGAGARSANQHALRGPRRPARDGRCPATPGGRHAAGSGRAAGGGVMSMAAALPGRMR